MSGSFGGMPSLATDQALAFLHFHFHYGMGATPHEHATGGHVPACIGSQPQPVDIIAFAHCIGLPKAR